MIGVDPGEMRRLNTTVTLQALYDGATMTKSQIATQTSLSRRTTELILADLIERDWVTEIAAAPGKTGRGRPPSFYQLQADRALILGSYIDVRTTTTTIADLRGRVLGSATIGVGTTTATPEECLAALLEGTETALRAAGRPKNLLRGGTVAIGGRVGDDGTVLRYPTQDSWSGINPGTWLGSRLKIDIGTENDLNVAALAERWNGAVTGLDTFFLLSAGQFAGAALVVRGELMRGVDGAAGELIYADALGFREIERHPLSHLSSRDSDKRASARELVARSRRGDAEAMALFDSFADLVAPVLGVIAWVIAPPVIVLGGGLEAAGDVLLSRLSTRLESQSLPPVELRMSQLSDDAVVLGALRHGIDRVRPELFASLPG